MKDKKDMSERLKYLQGQKNLQDKRRYLYLHQLFEVKELLEKNEKEIVYNDGWVKFHENAIEGHKKQIQETLNFEEKKDQEGKLGFHVKEIRNHHEQNLDYHKKEIDALKKEIQLFEGGVKRCEEQIEFLEKKIEGNTI